MKTRSLTALLLGGLLLAPAVAQAGPSADFPPASEHYSDVLDYTADWNNSTYTLGAANLPAGVTFIDNHDGTGHLGGPVQVPAGVYDIDLSATTPSDVTFHKNLALTVEPERAMDRLSRSNPVTVSRTKSFVLKARVKDQDDGSFGDIALADAGTFLLNRNGHVTTCDASKVAGSLSTTKDPGFFDVKCRVASGLHRGSYEVTHVVDGDYYAGTSRVGSLRITR